jgi:hypothetical protein
LLKTLLSEFLKLLAFDFPNNGFEIYLKTFSLEDANLLLLEFVLLSLGSFYYFFYLIIEGLKFVLLSLLIKLPPVNYIFDEFLKESLFSVKLKTVISLSP